jgi:recombinational DNA repair ATPase RecF
MITTVKHREKNVVNAFEVLFDNLNYETKKALSDYLAKSLKQEQKLNEQKFYSLFGSWKSDKSAEMIIAEIRNSRSSGQTRSIANFD